jgi:predicted small lipoprotein YifL
MMSRVILLSLTSLALVACGRAGAPYTPSEAARIEAKELGEPAPAAPTPNAQNQDKRFILDGLLD